MVSVLCSKIIQERSIAMRNASPLVASHTEDGSFIASDMVGQLLKIYKKIIS